MLEYLLSGIVKCNNSKPVSIPHHIYEHHGGILGFLYFIACHAAGFVYHQNNVNGGKVNICAGGKDKTCPFLTLKGHMTGI
ncbi:MAG: hypothetical protein ACOYYU_20730 [Chloroflexota bacterium]